MATRPPLAELDPGRRAALRIRLETAIAFRDGGLPGAGEAVSLEQDALRRQLHLAAMRVRFDPRQDVAAALKKVLDPIWKEHEQDSERLHPILRKRLARAKAALTAFACRHCAGEPTEASCRAEFDELFESMRELVEHLYISFAGKGFRRPDLWLELKCRGGASNEGLGRRALKAAVRFRDREDPASIVSLEIADDAFEWESLCQLPYLLGHELVCHAYQGLAGPGRDGVDQHCAWTEAWMDSLAVDVVENFLSDPDQPVPRWLDRKAAMRATAWLHEERLAGDLPQFASDHRRAARAASERLKALYLGQQAESERARERLFRFSLRFNLDPVSAEQRAAILDQIIFGLELFAGVELDDLVNACERYAAEGDVQRLAGDLNRLSMP